MTVFNPYAKQKKATLGVSAHSNPLSSKTNNATKPPIVAATPGVAVVTALNEPPLQPTNSTAPPSAPEVSLEPPSAHKTSKATVPRAITPFTISAKKGPVSFKAQLKQQIKELKLKKQIAQFPYHPSCYIIHELGMEHMGETKHDKRFSLFGTKGYWRNAWKVEALSHSISRKERETLVLKTLK